MSEYRIARTASPNMPEAELIEALAEDEARLGRPHTLRERDGFVRVFFAEEYAAEIRRLTALGVEEPGEDES